MEDIHGTKIVCIALAALMFSLILIPAGSATIGVKEGDWAKYDVEAEIPESEARGWKFFKKTEEMEWIKIEVESIYYDHWKFPNETVAFEGTIHYKNGTEESIGTWTTWTTETHALGESDLFSLPLPVIGSIHVYRNGTVSRNYAGARREVNYGELTNTTVTENENVTWTMKAYWDKATGFTCEKSMSLSGEAAGETVEMFISYRMTETNLWEAEAAPFITQWWFWAMVAVVIVALGGTVYFLKKRKPPTPTAPPPPPETSIE